VEPYRRIELFRWNQASFEAAVDADYPGLRQLNDFQNIKPFIAVLRNDSTHGIKAYVVKWSVIESTGRRYERTRIPWMGAGSREALTGEQIVWKPGERRLVSPSFDWGVSPSGIERRRKLLSALSKGPLATDAANALTVEISLDAVVYDDGVLSGPDKGNFCDRYECERNGELEEGAFVLSLLDLNLSDDEIVAQLNADIAKGQTQDGTDRANLLNAARGKEARIFLTVFNRNGRSGLQNLSLRLKSYDRTTLRRQ